MNYNIPLLITGCIKPYANQKWLYLGDSDIRLKQYIDSVLFYIKYSDFEKIIFCENSNYPFSPNDIYEIAKSVHKIFEWISFEGNRELIEKYDKGAGEIEIVNYALSNSKYLQECDSFAKVTGRLILANVNQIMSNIDQNKNYFLRDIYRHHLKAVDTRFYIANKKFYLTYLSTCYQSSNTHHKMALEDIFYSILNGNYSPFPQYFDFHGISGGNGRNYSKDSNIQKFFVAVFTKLRIYNTLFPIVWVICRIINKINLTKK